MLVLTFLDRRHVSPQALVDRHQAYKLLLKATRRKTRHTINFINFPLGEIQQRREIGATP